MEKLEQWPPDRRMNAEKVRYRWPSRNNGWNPAKIFIIRNHWEHRSRAKIEKVSGRVGAFGKPANRQSKAKQTPKRPRSGVEVGRVEIAPYSRGFCN